MKRFRSLALAAVMLFAVNTHAGCVRKYMDALEGCIHMGDIVDANICHMDATLEYVGCIRATLLF